MTNQPDTDLWAVHIAGPDDVLATASRDQAMRNAMWLNLGLMCLSDMDPIVWASPVVWDGEPEGHAASLAINNRDPRWSNVTDEILAGCARDAFGDGA